MLLNFTAEEYVPGFLAGLRRGYTQVCWTEHLLMRQPREVLLHALAALARAQLQPNPDAAVLAVIREALPAALFAAMETALRAPTGGPGRHLLEPAIILRAMRLAAERALPEDRFLNERLDPYGLPSQVESDHGLIASAVLLVHAIGDTFGLARGREGSDRPFGASSEAIGAELLRSSLFSDNDPPANQLGRTRRMWHHHGQHLRREEPPVLPLALAEQALGLPVDDVLTLGFVAYADALSTGLLDAPARKASAILERAPDLGLAQWQLFLDRFAGTADELTTSSLAATGDWSMSYLRQHPLLRLADDAILVLDPALLLSAITGGLYYRVFDHERDESDARRLAWTRVYGEMHELHVGDLVDAIAGRDGSTAMFTEDDIAVAYPGGGKIADFGFFHGDTCVLVEAVSGRFTLGSSEDGDLKALATDLEKIVLKKSRQLDETAAKILDRPKPTSGPLAHPATQVLPVIVTAGSFNVAPMTRQHLQQLLDRKQLLTDPRIGKLAVLSVRDFEFSIDVVTHKRVPLSKLLRGWHASRYRDASFTTYLAGRFHRPGRVVKRSTLLQQALDDSFQIILGRTVEHPRYVEQGRAADPPDPPTRSAPER